MTFQPLVPFGGIAGKIFLERTRENQQAAFVESPRIERNTTAFSERIASITTAEDLVEDRQLLEVALGAFGLDDDINNKFFIERILSSNPSDDQALANRLSDKRYLEFSKAFGFGDIIGPRTLDPGFASQIIGAYEDRQFEVAVGEQNSDMRLILGFERDLTEITARSELSDDAKWFSIMAAPPLRRVFETALGFPTSFGALDLDRQLNDFRTRSEQVFGVTEISDFATPEKIDELERLFLARSQINEASSALTSGGSIALTLLRGF